MTGDERTTIITGLFGIVGALITGVFAVILAKIQKLTARMDGRVDELLRLTRAEGKIAGIAEEKERGEAEGSASNPAHSQQ